MGPFDVNCPRCERELSTQCVEPPPLHPPPVARPAEEPWPVVRRRLGRNLAILSACVIAIILLIGQLRRMSSDATESWHELAPEVLGARENESYSPPIAPPTAAEYAPPSYTPPVYAPAPRSWVQVATWSGNGIKSTPAFTVGDEWAIEWATQPGQYGDMNFAIITKGTDGSWAGLDANIIGVGNDVSYHYEAGTYYLEINSGQPWAVSIWDKR